ncbi:MAG: hypothetical protein FJ202_10400 [Gemmatimonadetes bacterium]|nr:hypothetical protein [Gemmatimonadota bacterium]
MRTATSLGLVLALGAPVVGAFAQRADSARADSARALSKVTVTVTRAGDSATRAPWAIGVQNRAEIARAQATLGIDEALNSIPGVVVANRYNYSLDQRLSIRGAGSRANFGTRGVKILLDGIPQSLPDGQNQLTNVDLAAVSRVEVLRGSASSLYGNGSGGVIAFETDKSAPDRLGATLRLTSGSYDMQKVQGRLAGRAGGMIRSLSASRTVVGGFRQFDSAEVRQAILAVDRSLGAGRTLALRASYGDTPTSHNPGALTPAEYAKNRDSAASFNTARNANKVLSQAQYSLRFSDTRDAGEHGLAVYLQRRFVDNPLATAPPGTTGAAIGTLSTLNRWVTGARFDANHRWRDVRGAPRVAIGFDAQRSLDIRRNWRVTGGKRTVATDTLFLDQGESVIALGPFASVQWMPSERLLMSAGARADRLTYTVSDFFLRDGLNNSATREMSATTGHFGLSWAAHPALTLHGNLATAFETPTTTEMLARQDGAGGFNPDLGPQNIRTTEAGARGTMGPRIDYNVTLFSSRYTNAIIQFLETNGRAFFRNAGETKNAGAEIGVTARPVSWLDASVAWTQSRYRFAKYRVQNRAVVDTLDGRRVAGVADKFVRFGLRARWRDAALDLDHTAAGDLFADDRNTQKVDGWGDGALNIRLSWDGIVRGARVAPFVAVNNAFNVAYVGSVNVNGANNRILEPAPLRNFYVGVETGWRVVP